MNTFFLMPVLWLAVLPGADCRPVTGDRILAGDFAQTIPAFSALPPDLAIGYSPQPGAQRAFRDDEVRRIARTHGIEDTALPGISFCWPMSAITDQQASESMQASLKLPAARIGIIDLSPRHVPPGKLVFPREALSGTASGNRDPILVWRGYVQYSEGRRYPVSARVRVAIATSRVVAASPLKAGQAIPAEQIREETYEDLPFRDALARSAAEVAGRVPRRSIAQGAAILKSDLMTAFDVAKGDVVQVVVRDGAAQLRLEAKAESDGRTGDTIPVLNLQSRKTFSARVEAKGRVVVVVKGNLR